MIYLTSGSEVSSFFNFENKDSVKFLGDQSTITSKAKTLKIMNRISSVWSFRSKISPKRFTNR